MKLYNSKTLKVEEFVPIRKNHVDMYVCGPTVYNDIHIGNARPIVVFDTLKRVFLASGYTVKYVSNYTDVDDKIIHKAMQQGVSEAVITQRYIEAYNQVRKALNTQELEAAPMVTNTMDEIIDFIDQLVMNGYAYCVDGDVYFRINSIDTYGEISHQNIEDLKVGARIEENTKKENPLDFSLWKKTDMGIKWQSKWGLGRPGWHSECVVMICNEFKTSLIDIHGGGMDLRFPHHENETAQARALYKSGLANYWLHNAMINLDGEKMSKSLGNTVAAKDVLQQLGSNATRWLLLSTHYRSEANFSDLTIETAVKELEKVMNPLKQAYIKLELASYGLEDEYDQTSFHAFLAYMQDDLNTPNAMAEIFETVKKLNQCMRVKDIDLKQINLLVCSLEKMLDVLGIKVTRMVLTSAQREMFERWNDAKAKKDFALADQYRQTLMQEGLL
ncbi:MAG: cysteine--tRNA ligase [Erysipelotrichaceae bacterium]|nr:cysteine--tRNA ligase [Erysipelotrichaceae bacterium]